MPSRTPLSTLVALAAGTVLSGTPAAARAQAPVRPGGAVRPLL